MTRPTLLLLASLVPAISASGAQSKPVLSDQQILIKLERDWDAAFHRKDVAFIESVLADEFVSTYGDANAQVEADVTVEAGKLSEATVSHSAARVTFKLVAREGGEALPDTQWTVQTADGEVVKRSVGALPTHIIAPGSYTVIAKSGTRAFKRDFTVADGEATQVEVLMR